MTRLHTRVQVFLRKRMKAQQMTPTLVKLSSENCRKRGARTAALALFLAALSIGPKLHAGAPHPAFRCRSAAAEIRGERIESEEVPSAYASRLYGEEVANGLADRDARRCASARETDRRFLLDDEYLFQEGEWHFDAFFTIVKAQRQKNPDADQALYGEGGGLAVSYYPARWFGVGAEGMVMSGLRYQGEAAGLAYLRLPCDVAGISFQAFGGFGATFESSNATASYLYGAALEFRLLEHVGLIFDVRDTRSFSGIGYYGARAGLRIVF